MSIVIWVLLALAAGLIAEEFLGWVTPLCRIVLRRGAERLPAEWRARYAEEWQADLLALPEAAITRILWTTRTRLGVGSLRAELADAASLHPVAPAALAAPTGWPVSGGFVGLEQSASLIRSYESHVIPSLLQTPDYARTLLALSRSWRHTDELDRAVLAQIERQQFLTREAPGRLWVVLDEAALRRPLGGVKTMRAQLEHLIEVSRRPNVTVQVLPFGSGGCYGVGRAFTILRHPILDQPQIVYLEELTTALYLDEMSDVEHYVVVMDQLSIAAPPPRATSDILHQVLADLS